MLHILNQIVNVTGSNAQPASTAIQTDAQCEREHHSQNTSNRWPMRWQNQLRSEVALYYWIDDLDLEVTNFEYWVEATFEMMLDRIWMVFKISISLLY